MVIGLTDNPRGENDYSPQTQTFHGGLLPGEL
jgi:hypothetical protein